MKIECLIVGIEVRTRGENSFVMLEPLIYSRVAEIKFPITAEQAKSVNIGDRVYLVDPLQSMPLTGTVRAEDGKIFDGKEWLPMDDWNKKTAILG